MHKILNSGQNFFPKKLTTFYLFIEMVGFQVFVFKILALRDHLKENHPRFLSAQNPK